MRQLYCYTNIYAYSLSKNPNITWDIVEANPNKPWCYNYLSKNPNITLDIVGANPDCPWNYNYLSSNPNITWDIVEDYKHKQSDYSNLSNNHMKKHKFFQTKQFSYVLK